MPRTSPVESFELRLQGLINLALLDYDIPDTNVWQAAGRIARIIAKEKWVEGGRTVAQAVTDTMD